MACGRRAGRAPGLRWLRENQLSGPPGTILSGAGSFTDETGQVEGQGKGIAEDGGLGGIRQAEERRAFELAAGLIGVAGFGVGETAETQVPGRGFDRRRWLCAPR